MTPSEAMGVDTILVEVDELGVAVITLNRPASLNAVTLAMEELFVEVFRQLDDDPKVRCIVITGAGRAFCAGDDVKAGWGEASMDASIAALDSPAADMVEYVEAMLRATTPTIAAVNGLAIGWGMDVALLCDIAIASDTARFSQRFVSMGLVPHVAGVWALPQVVGRSAAMELLLTGDIIDAAEALRLGLVSRVVPGSDLMDTAGALAGRIAANPPLAVAAIKELVRRAAGKSVAELDDLAPLLGLRLRRLFDTDDHREAVAAFAERRPPRFTGS
ncbi:MAG: enoyl-CoA hydratase/isomerase family protein [Acidimicrobiia bacterium]